MTDDDRRPPEPMPWDRVGTFLGDLATAGKSVTDRNLKLWTSVSQNLRKPAYTADDWAADAARGMQAAMSNAQEVWDAAMRAPERERVADTLPTAFFVLTPHLDPKGELLWGPPDPVWMRVRDADFDELPATAEIELAGDKCGVDKLRKYLRTERGEFRQAYLLRIVAARDLVAGVYGGSAFVKTPHIRPIANLKIIVEDPQRPSSYESPA